MLSATTTFRPGELICFKGRDHYVVDLVYFVSRKTASIAIKPLSKWWVIQIAQVFFYRIIH